MVFISHIRYLYRFSPVSIVIWGRLNMIALRLPLRSIDKQVLPLDNDEGLDTSLCLVVAQLQSALRQGDKAIGSINS